MKSNEDGEKEEIKKERLEENLSFFLLWGMQMEISTVEEWLLCNSSSLAFYSYSEWWRKMSVS